MGRNKHAIFQIIRDRVWQKLQGWKEILFSKAGKEILLNAMVQTIPSYSMSCFKLPDSLIKDIQRLIRRFWWSGGLDKKGIPWLHWEVLCSHKSKGGLGFQSLAEFNQALPAKQCWRIIKNPSSLLAHVFKAKYFPLGDLFLARQCNHPSHVWHGLLWVMELLRLGCVWRIDDGHSLKFFSDKWLNKPHSFSLFNLGFLPFYSTVASLITPLGQWNFDFLAAYFHADNVSAIIKVSIGGHGVANKLAWFFSKSVHYSVKAGYWAAMDCLERGKNKFVWVSLVGLVIFLGGRRFGGLIFLTGLNTSFGGLLMRFITVMVIFLEDIIISNVCHRRNLEIEDGVHAIWGCKVSRQVWKL